MDWFYNNQVVEEIKDGSYGFIYLLEYDDGSKYIGKKSIISCIKLPALKTGLVRPNARRIAKRVPMTKQELLKRTPVQVKSGTRTKLVDYDVICKESKWKDYEGSKDDIGDRQLVSKTILKLCPDKTNLTYWEVAMMCKLDVLTDDTYINGNCGGLYYRGKIFK